MMTPTNWKAPDTGDAPLIVKFRQGSESKAAPLIQAIARALCDDTLKRWRSPIGVQAEPWREFIPAAQAALTAITEAGYAVVPIEPTEAMLERGRWKAESCTNDWTRAAACLPGHVYSSMISAAQGDGE